MTAQQKSLQAPTLDEAGPDRVLHVDSLGENAHSKVLPFINQSVGDTVTLEVDTSTGNSFRVEIELTADTLGEVLTFAIPTETFKKGLVPGATANLKYIVARVNQSPETSLPLLIKLEK
ncbi:hypothetical protein OXH62_21640 [Pseudomonas chlororaphis]|uniref:hypothetical protein n=1 Tax=Pseudomonas chlororaphis TaxID=587753 RepID=UPI0035D4E5D2